MVADHQSDITHIASYLNKVSLDLSPKDQIYKDLQDFFDSVQINDLLVTFQALNDNNVQAVIVDNNLLLKGIT